MHHFVNKPVSPLYAKGFVCYKALALWPEVHTMKQFGSMKKDILLSNAQVSYSSPK
jgi:hypothetical protein